MRSLRKWNDIICQKWTHLKLIEFELVIVGEPKWICQQAITLIPTLMVTHPFKSDFAQISSISSFSDISCSERTFSCCCCSSFSNFRRSAVSASSLSVVIFDVERSSVRSAVISDNCNGIITKWNLQYTIVNFHVSLTVFFSFTSIDYSVQLSNRKQHGKQQKNSCYISTIYTCVNFRMCSIRTKH